MMKIKWLKRPFDSVFTKLIVVMLVSGTLLVIGIISVSWHGFRESQKTFLNNNLAHYGSYLVSDLQDNLNLQHALKLSKRLLLVIRYEGEDSSWQTGKGIPPLHKVHLRKWSDSSGFTSGLHSQSDKSVVKNVHFGRYRGHFVVTVETNSGRFIFAKSEKWHEMRLGIPWILSILVLTGLILTLTWIAMRWIMKPINWLSEGVSAIGDGNMEHRLPEKRGDELGKLARAFNKMSGRLREMLEARERLLLDVSHELRSPLTRMKVALEFVQEDKTRDSLLGDVQEMEQMLTEILETARLKSEHGNLELQTVDLNKLIQEVCSEFEGKIPGILFDRDGREYTVHIDIEQIQTVLKNILVNALKYSVPGNDPVHVRLSKDASGYIIEIQDQGQGIPEDELELIFEPFYRVDKSRTKLTGGYGLGLSMCKTIIEAHGGRISVRSKPGEGAAFCIRLPDSTEKN